MIYYINPNKKKRNTAGAKAPDDIVELCRRRGYTEASFKQWPVGKSKLYQHLWVQVVGNSDWRSLYKKVGDGDVVIFQHPFYGKRTSLLWIKRIRQKGAKMIALIHDLESLRGGIAGVIEAGKTTAFGDDEFLKNFDGIICHNEHMRQYMIEKGFEPSRLVDLEIFDYLTDEKISERQKSEAPTVAIAGNLALGKCAYIYKIHENGHNPGLALELYGIRFEEERADAGMKYHGSFAPEELPGKLKGDFGLVWDGIEATTCAGNTGEYLKYNDPHKTSLYLASGLPVIVWSKAAIADFVLKNKVGVTVDSLYELEDKIRSISEQEYTEMCANARDISSKLRKGHYFYSALDKCLEFTC
jgi:hypothetical protein